MPVPDPRLDALAEIVKPQKVIPTAVEFVDIAGLVAGASKGEGLGNQFLAHIREVDAIAHVVRCFEDRDVIHVANKIDPIADIETIDTELALADLESVEKALQRAERIGQDRRQGSQGRAPRCCGRVARRAWTRASRRARWAFGRRQAAGPRPVPADAEAGDVRRQRARGRLREQPAPGRRPRRAPRARAPRWCRCRAAIEEELSQLDDADRDTFLADMGLDEPGLNRVIRAAYKLLGLQTYFTAGREGSPRLDVRAGSTAPQAAAVIHTDFEKGFIRAETIAYDDFIRYKGESGAREAGRLRLEGKEYLVKEGDVMHFRFNV